MTETADERDRLDQLRRDAWDLILRATSGEATRADIVDVKRWCERSPDHAEAFARASEHWRALGPAIKNIERERAFPGQRVKSQPILGRRALLGGALAATAAGAAVMVVRPPYGLWPSASELTADYRTATGEQRRIALTDRLSVEMNTRTSLNIRAANAETESIELISGEATVASQSRSVEVTAAAGRASAATAQFNVRCEGAQVIVTCLGGQVQVERSGRSLMLGPRQQVAYAGNGLREPVSIDPGVVTGWRQGDLRFENEPLSRVIDEVNRYRPGRIILANETLGQRRYSARFKLDRLEVVILQLRATFGARVTTLPGGFVIVS